MTTQHAGYPPTLNASAFAETRSGLPATTTSYRYDEAARPRRASAVSRPGSRRPSHDVASPQRPRDRDPSMSVHPNGTAAAPQAMFVRAQYDYDADDRTSLSFKQGDLIQVITQLESGWWDGILRGVRGWFPSNYCALVPNEDGQSDAQSADEAESGPEDEIESSHAMGTMANGNILQQTHSSVDYDEEDPSAYWVPQATPDGRLYYYNTKTGVSTMELPLQTPPNNETGPRDRMNFNVNEQTRPPPEMMAGGWQLEEDDAAASEAEEAIVRAQSMRRRRSQLSDGVSPAPSVESLSTSPVSRARKGSRDLYRTNQSAGGMAMPGVTVPGFNGTFLGQYPSSNVPRSFFDDGMVPPLTWNRLVENMRKSVESYRQAISNSDRTEYVRRAEDISDHLRMLLAAGSGTTDNHSGNPSIISTNKSLYPHFRDMMSRFSKLVLSSHIAAADWPAPDAYSKCLQEAEGVLHGVYGYVEIARAQRGEEIPRLVPGFVQGSLVGGNWQSNHVGSRDTMTSTSFMDQDEYDTMVDNTTPLDVTALEQIDDLKRNVVTSIRRLDEHLIVTDKVVTPARHEELSSTICSAAITVVESLRPCIALVETLNLSPLGSSTQTPQLLEFAAHKQRMYDLSGALVVGCQTVAGPLSDEWSETRGESLDERIRDLKSVANQLEKTVSQMALCIQALLQSKPKEKTSRNDIHRRKESSAAEYSPSHLRNAPRVKSRYTESSQSIAYGDNEPLTDAFRDKPKLGKFFGVTVQEEFLQLEHENELAWDKKLDTPTVRGGTLTALVEQLTRHDKLDTVFNNTFLLTHRSFTTAAELFEMLVKRFTVQPPRGISQENYRTWVEKKQKPIRFRVVNILKSWFDSYWQEGRDEASLDLLRRVHAFAKESVATSSTPGSGPLIAVIEQRLKGQDPGQRRIVISNMNGQAPTPIVPKNMKKLKFLDIDPTEFARQLTLIESSLYGKIKATECLNKTWQTKVGRDEEDPAANVHALILHSNQLTNWVAEAILAQNDVKRRGYVIKHFVTVADKCRQLNNFSTLTSIISALGTAPIHRLNRTWNQVNARTSTTLETMRRLMASNKNFGEYRETLHSVNPPCIPFFGTYLTDLTFIEDGIPSIIKKTDLINFSKWSKVAEVIRDIQQYQNVPYPLTPVKELQEYILTNMQNAGDVHEMYDKSLAVEPREREDEKIARLLSESGFL